MSEQTSHNFTEHWNKYESNLHPLEIVSNDYYFYYFPSVIVSHRFASSRSGYIFEIDYSRVVIRNIRRLLPAQQQHANREDKWTFNTGVLRINQSEKVFVNKLV